MKDSSYGPLNMTVRVQENELLDRNHYERMVQANSYNEALDVLLDTKYRLKIEQAKGTKEYEFFLMEELKETYDWVIDQSPSQALSELLVLRYAYHNIKVLYKEKLTAKDFSGTLIDIGVYPMYELRREVTQGDSDQLPKYYRQNIRNLNIEFEETPSINDIDIFVDRAYIHHLKRLAEEINDSFVTDYVEKLIDYRNISIFFRALYANRGKTHLQATLTDEGAIPLEFFLEASEGGVESAIRIFSNLAEYGEIINQAYDSDGEFSLRRLEQATDIETETYLSSASFEVFGPLPVLAFVSAKEIEVKNIRLALTGQLNHIDSELVKDRMRLEYAV